MAPRSTPGTAPKSSSPRKPFTPRPARPLEERLKKLHAALLDQIREGYLDNAIRTCKKILSLSPEDKPASETHLFLLLQQDRYAEALALVQPPTSTSPASSASSAQRNFERAYCLYRLHREGEALRLVGETRRLCTEQGLDLGLEREDGMGRKLDSLEAQICYRTGKYQRADELFVALQASCPADSPEHDDLSHNLASTRANLEFATTGYAAYLPAGSGSAVESTVPALPTRAAGASAAASTSRAATGGASGSKVLMPEASKTSAASTGSAATTNKKPRHKLPKGVTLGQPNTQDPDRWLPLRQRASYIAAQSSAPSKRKKGKKEGMGTGMTQGSAEGGGTAGGGSGTNTPKGKGKGKR